MIREDFFESEIHEQQTTIPEGEGVCFDPDELSLTGYYEDELSAYRAKKLWIETLETAFLLDPDQDFEIHSSAQDDRFILDCRFHTACARYAFWRLTNSQAPEAQYQIETAHIPNTESRHADFITAPDLRSIHDTDNYETQLLSIQDSEGDGPIVEHDSSFYQLVKRLIQSIAKGE